MGPAPSLDEETRLVFQVGEEKLVLMAHETFQTAAKNFDKKIRNAYSREFLVMPLEPADRKERKALTLKGKGFLLTPRSSSRGDPDARLVLAALVVLPDKTIVFLSTYVNAAAFKDRKGCRKLAEAILGSASAGDKQLSLKAGPKRLWVYSEAEELSLDLPENYVVTSSQGVDFLVYHIRPVSEFGSSPGVLSIYFGMHPAYIHQQMRQEEDSPAIAVRKVPTRILGKKVSWYLWSLSSGGKRRRRAEAMVKGAVRSQSADVVHVFLNAPSDEEREALQKMALTLKVVKRTKENDSKKTPSSVPGEAKQPATE